jgi:nitroimidazol reductase NimA-like FMN-containing flavoprotein (pyridoxamine 5'-phosphate oxidase superfamily)
MDDDITTVLSEEECWEALRADELGRLAYLLGDTIDIVPVNYAVDGTTLLFRTAEGSKLLGVAMHPEVVFEIDGYDAAHAVSVVVRGIARQLGEDEEHRAEVVPLRSWLGTMKYNVVEITPTELSGRRFALDRPKDS